MENNKVTESQTIDALNKAWKSTCAVLLKEEVCDLLECEAYLKRYIDPIGKRKSSISGKDVAISSTKVLKDANVIAYDEAAEYRNKTAKFMLDVNSIKDLDSIMEAVKEKVYYTGNIILGNSGNVISSHRCVNTFYALGCQDVYDGKFVAFTTSIRSPEYSFGCCFGGDIQFCIKVLDPYKQVRCLETFHCNVASDCYYSATLEDCTDCMFSFNQRNKHYMIGNVPLAKDRYAGLKDKLIREIAGEFKKKKKLPSVVELISGRGDWNE